MLNHIEPVSTRHVDASCMARTMKPAETSQKPTKVRIGRPHDARGLYTLQAPRTRPAKQRAKPCFVDCDVLHLTVLQNDASMASHPGLTLLQGKRTTLHDKVPRLVITCGAAVVTRMLCFLCIFKRAFRVWQSLQSPAVQAGKATTERLVHHLYKPVHCHPQSVV